MDITDTAAGGVLLSRCVLGDADTMPTAVAAWVAEHARLPQEHQHRVRELYDKQMDENISESEHAELDHYAEIIAAIDILRARAGAILRAAA